MRTSKNIVIAILLMQAFMSCMILGENRNSQPNVLYPVTHVEPFDVEGIIFSDTTSFPFLNRMNPQNFHKRFSPTLDDILLFEKVFHEKYEEYTKQKSLYNPRLDNSSMLYRDWGRHYFGYIDNNGHKFLLVYLTKLESRREWKNWRKGPFVQTPGQFSIFFNLDTKNLLGWNDVNL